MKIAMADGVRLFVDSEGAGLRFDERAWVAKPTLVLLHGGPGSDHTVFRPSLSALADAVQLIHVDQRGNGRSDPGSPESWTLDRWAQDVLDLCAQLGLHRPILLGYSFGAFVAVRAAALQPERVGGLILLNATARLCADRIAAAFGRLAGGDAAAAALRFWSDASRDTLKPYARLCVPHYARADAAREVLRHTARHVELTLHFCGAGGEAHRLDLRPALAQLRCKVLVVAGEDDPVATAADTAELCAAIPPSLLTALRIPSARHAVHLDATVAVLAAIRGFVQSLSAPVPAGV